ncbi:MAG TPA: alpha/beta fold hydrolase [Chitinophagales bacterium]|nr:alpha/beta fold hydrolase [Chitinophagales bacterium]
MKTLFSFLTLLSITSFSSAQPAPDQLAGTWQGTLQAQGVSLRFVAHIKNENGNLSATMDSPDQGVVGIPVSSVNYTAGKLDFAVAPGASYHGEWNSDHFEGKWSQNGSDFPLNLSRENNPVEPNRPQEPKPPFPYTATDVTFANSIQKNTIAGTLTIPEGKGPFPAVILITGSGQENRNEELMGHKPFLVIADYLSRNGIAVLRCDDRGVGGTTGEVMKATSEDFATDIEAALDFLKTQRGVDVKRIGLIGHSEGGGIAQMVAKNHSEVSFIIMIGGLAIDGGRDLYLQNEKFYAGSGVPGEVAKKYLMLFQQMIDTIKTQKTTDEKHKAISTLLNNGRKQFSEDELKYVPNLQDEKSIEVLANQMILPWMQSFINYDPQPALKTLKCDILAIYGEKDIQVPAKENSEAFGQTMQNGQSKINKVVVMPGLNHLMQHATTGMPSEYGTIEETFSPEVLKMIADFILKR